MTHQANQTHPITQTLLPIRGTRLYVEIAGPADAPALLYLHGGPGGHGCYEFMLHGGSQLAETFRVIGLDQRGVLRSDPLPENAQLTLDDLIEDCEAVREALNISTWAVLGHSFGGYLAVLYALAHPASIDALLLEAPTFDIGLSTRSILRAAAAEYRSIGLDPQATACDLVADDFSLTTRELDAQTSPLLADLKERIANLFVHGPDKNFLGRLIEQSPFPKERWDQSTRQRIQLFAEGRAFESLLPLLSKISHRTLLLRGEHDPITSPDQVAAFKQSVPQAREVVFHHSGHSPKVEETARYVQTITDFLLR
jgi:proline iminopeptidase